MTETNIRMEKKLEETDTRRSHDAETLELLQKTEEYRGFQNYRSLYISSKKIYLAFLKHI